MHLLDYEETVGRQQQYHFWIKDNILCNSVLMLDEITWQRLNTNELTGVRTYKTSWAVWFCGIGKQLWKIHFMLIYCSKIIDWIATKKVKTGSHECQTACGAATQRFVYSDIVLSVTLSCGSFLMGAGAVISHWLPDGSRKPRAHVLTNGGEKTAAQSDCTLPAKRHWAGAQREHWDTCQV